MGPFRLDTEAKVLSASGSPLPLGARAVAVLATLVENAHQHVPKSRIMDVAWPGVVVEESNLTVQISAIRKVLAQAPGGERWVETLPRRGYRYVGPVTPLAPGAQRESTNLAAPATSFIGREREVEELCELLRRARLVTLVGTGGIGKTFLAQHVARTLVDEYADGAWFVDLASLSDPELAPSAVAQVLRLQHAAGRPLVESLRGHLREQRLLVVLDNCEHLLEAAARVADALRRAGPGLAILATSREPLRIEGEVIHRLPSLTLPEPSADPEAMACSEAVRLFVERAREQEPDFALSAETGPAIARICIHLDGIPLALELAAARVRSLSVDQIGERLQDRFRLLTTGSRTALPRQQTLRAMLDWSFDLLSHPERVVLRRCAIFAGRFTLDAVAAVASCSSIDEHAGADVLLQLVGRSLVVADTSGRVAHYRLLETTRAYALELLGESGELERLRGRHAAYYQQLMERASAEWLKVPESRWCEAYEGDLDNVRAALEHGDRADPAIAVAVAGASGPAWTVLSLNGEGVQRLERAAALIEPDMPIAHQARLWFWLGMLADSAPARALPAFQRAIALYRRLHDPVSLGHALMRQARAFGSLDRLPAAREALHEGFSLLQGSGLPRVIGLYYEYLGFLELLGGDPHAARVSMERSIAIYREAGLGGTSTDTLGNLADATWALGDLDAAAGALREIVSQLRRAPPGRRRSLGFNLANLAGVLAERGETEAALASAREALPMLRAGGYAWIFVDYLALCAALARRPARAAQLAGFADAAYAVHQSVRQPNEARACERVARLLAEALPADELARLRQEGARMDEDDAWRIALD